MRFAAIITAFAVLTGVANASPYVETLEEINGAVWGFGSGQIDLTGLYPLVTAPAAGSIEPSPLAAFSSGVGSAFFYAGSIIGPVNFGSGGENTTLNVDGDPVGFDSSLGAIKVPLQYVPDSPLSNMLRFDNASFVTLGVTPGTYTWSWGDAPDQSITLQIGPLGPVAVSLPASLLLFVSGLGALGLLGWRRENSTAALHPGTAQVDNRILR